LEFLYANRWANRSVALAEVGTQSEYLLREGGVGIRYDEREQDKDEDVDGRRQGPFVELFLEKTISGKFMSTRNKTERQREIYIYIDILQQSSGAVSKSRVRVGKEREHSFQCLSFGRLHRRHGIRKSRAKTDTARGTVRRSSRS
jgi:hypothetical protein